MRKAPSPNREPEQVIRKKLDWEMLKQWSEEGIVCLKYLDESGCYCQSPTDYSYSQRGKQKRLEQKHRRGRRINIFGVWQPKQKFDYALMLGNLKGETYIQLINWQAKQAQARLKATGQWTVIVLDNASVHRSFLVQNNWHQWQEQGLLFFFLPPYSPQMNRIEDRWLHLKREELAGRIFEDEVELAYGIMEGMKSQSFKGGWEVERFIFN